jgi:hypothetical protein
VTILRYKKHFTPEEAREYLPQLKYDMTQIITLKDKLDTIGFNIYTRKYRPGFHPDTLTEYPDDFLQLMEIMQSLQEDGILIKGIEEGLADFPAIRQNGEEVFLCWKDGEEDIEFWHSLDAGYRGRRPLADF